MEATLKHPTLTHNATLNVNHRRIVPATSAHDTLTIVGTIVIATTEHAMEHGAHQKASTKHCGFNLRKNKQCLQSISWTPCSYWHI